MGKGARKTRAPDVLKGLAHASETAKARADILLAYETVARARRAASLAAFVAAYNANEIDVHPETRERIATVSVVTLKRWRAAAGRGGAPGLEPRYGNRRNDGLIGRDPDLRDFIVGQIAARPHISAAMMMEGLRARFGNADKNRNRDLPSPRSVERFMRRWKGENRAALTAMADPDTWKSKYQAAAGYRSQNIQRPNQLWELDSTLGDILLLDEGGRAKRYALIKVVDVATRRALMLVDRSSRAASIAALMRKAILAWGVPEAIKTDNGRDYTSRGIESICDALAIERVLCQPFTPEAKPHVERCFRSFQHGLVELLPGYIGHDVAGRKAINARRAFADRLGERDGAVEVRLSPDEFQEIADRWAEDLYAARVHSALGRSPREQAAAYEGVLTTIDDERALDILLLPASGEEGFRVVGKKGVQILGGHYAHGALGAMVGDPVRVLTDPADLGHVYIFDRNGAFVCEALNYLRRGVSAEDVAAEKSKIQKRVVAEQRRELRATMRRVRTDDLAREILTKAGEDAGKVVRMAPPRRQLHRTPDLEAAGKAARAGGFAVREDTPEERAARETLAESLAPKPLTTKQTSMDRARAIERALKEQRDVSEADRIWLANFQKSNHYKAAVQFDAFLNGQQSDRKS